MNDLKDARILMVDDDESLLAAFRRTYRKQLSLTMALGPEEGLRAIRECEPFDVVVSDYQMPGMNGVEFLAEVQRLSPDSVRVMLTGNADLNSAIQAVNQGNVFRFLTKPCSPDLFLPMITCAVEQARLIHAERGLLENTVRGIVEVMADLLSLTSPKVFKRAMRIQHYVTQIAERAQSSDSWVFESAALLSQIGIVALPEGVVRCVESNVELDVSIKQLYYRHPEVGSELISKIPRLEDVASIVKLQAARHDDPVLETVSPVVALGSRILASAIAFDGYFSDGLDRRGALTRMKSDEGAFQPEILDLMEWVRLPEQKTAMRVATFNELRVGMILGESIFLADGTKLAFKGDKITAGLMARLGNHDKLGDLPAEYVVLTRQEELPENHLRIA